MENTKDTKQQESPPLPAPAGSGDGYRKMLVREIGTDDVCILLAWQRMAIRLGELWNSHIELAKKQGDIGFIREQEAVSELRQLCATLPPNDKLSGGGATEQQHETERTPRRPLE
jgi:hypothetical protein